jgi:CRISPR type III-A-associated RAMP protein Csm5
MILKLRTLTPLHIGDGSLMHPFDYTILDGRFYRCSAQFFERFLETLGPQAGEQFANWSGTIMDQMMDLDENRRINPHLGKDYNQNMSALRKKHTLVEFAQSINQTKAYHLFLKENAPSIPNQPVGKNEKEKQEYRGFQRSSDGTAFLPGSSIKGSIRTALLYHFLENNDNHSEVRQILEDSIATVKREKQDALMKKLRFNPTRHIKSFGERLEQLTFFSEMINERNQPKNQEAQDDLMRCLLISDTSIPNKDIGIENIDLYLVKKLPKFQGVGFEGQRQTQSPAVEAVLPDKELDIHLEFNADLLLQLHHTSGDQGIQIGREKHFIGWRKRARILFNLSEDDFTAVPEKVRYDHPALKSIREKALKHIISCCRVFSDAQANAFAMWQSNFGKHARDKYMARDLEAGSFPVFSAKGTRLHLGFATGFEGMTIVLHLLSNHKKQFSEIMELFGIGDSPNAGKNRRPGQVYLANPDRFPTSRRLATRSGVIYPLGWLEWVDDPEAQSRKSNIQKVQNEPNPTTTKPETPVGPVFMRGTLKQFAEVDAELMQEGNPGRFKLFIREDYQPILEVKYAAGFKTVDIGRIARLRVKNVSGKGEVIAVEFIRYK